MAKPTDAELENRFLYHNATREAAARHVIVSDSTLDLAKLLRDIVPEGRGLSCALTALEEVRMWANQGIATNHAGCETGTSYIGGRYVRGDVEVRT